MEYLAWSLWLKLSLELLVYATKVQLVVILQCEIWHKIDLPSPPVSHVFTYSIQFFLTWLLWCGTEIRFFFCCYLLQSVFSCLSGLAFFICLSLSAKLPFLCMSGKSLCLPVVCIEFLYPLIQLLLLARKQSKYNCSLSGPPRHWFIHSLLQVGVTNPRGSQPIHTTKIYRWLFYRHTHGVDSVWTRAVRAEAQGDNQQQMHCHSAQHFQLLTLCCARHTLCSQYLLHHSISIQSSSIDAWYLLMSQHPSFQW